MRFIVLFLNQVWETFSVWAKAQSITGPCYPKSLSHKGTVI